MEIPMYVSEAVVKNGNDLVLETHEVRGVKTLTAAVVNELFCTHDGRACNEAFCLISPPDWTYRVGLGFRFSLGSRLWHLGQWATCMDHRVVREEAISESVAVDTFGWDRDILAEALTPDVKD